MAESCRQKLRLGSMKPLAPKCEFIIIYSNHSYSSCKVQCANTYIQKEQHAKIQPRMSLGHLPIALAHTNSSSAFVGAICETKTRKKVFGAQTKF